MHQNVTLKLDKELLREAKVYATEAGKSLSRLMVDALRALIGKASAYEKAHKKALSFLHKGFKLGGGPYYGSREELHSRHGR
ncbi:MAG: hypothetical protein HY542_00435 [Deltaproteobacteria bacterium]|nr:hypothetical protein [Deltaproteobacteria bacterium]